MVMIMCIKEQVQQPRLYVHPTNGDFAFGGAGGSATKVHPNGTIPVGVLERHTWVWDGTTLNIYHNENSTPFHTDTYTFTTSTELWINAADPTSSSDYHHPKTGIVPMKLYGVNIFQSALDATQLQALWGQTGSKVAGQTVALALTANVPLEQSGQYQVAMGATDVSGVFGVAQVVKEPSFVGTKYFFPRFVLSRKIDRWLL